MREVELGIRAALAACIALSWGAAHARAQQASATQPTVEALMKARKWKEAIARADEIRQLQPGGTPDAEFFAARCLRNLKRHGEARQRFLELAANHPTSPRARVARADAAIMLFAPLQSVARTEGDRAAAAKAATELGVLAKELGDFPDDLARTLYLRGNALRMSLQDEEAGATQLECMLMETTTAYPSKCALEASFLALRRLDVAGSTSLLKGCLASASVDRRTAKRCQKALDQQDVVGTQLTGKLDVSTWLHGSPVSWDDLRGRVVLAFHFATWCPHCKRAMPWMVDYKKRFGAKGLEVFGLTNNEKSQTTELAREFVKDPQWGVDFPCALDHDGATRAALQVTGLPSAALVDRKGVIRWVGHPNYLTDYAIETLLAENGTDSKG